MNRQKTHWIGTLMTLGMTACAGSGSSGSANTCTTPAAATATVEHYAAGVYASYQAMLTTAQSMKSAVDAFLASPSTGTLATARAAWLTARDSYGETEVFRFYAGPIDAETGGVEGRLNAWPMDESYVDYVVDGANILMNGIIQGTATLDATTLAALNEQGGEQNVATGWHAIEFLLWGQDHSDTGPGDRPFTDFVEGPSGTGGNQDRRRTYLQVVTNLLVADLQSVADQWTPNQANYRQSFVANPSVALLRMLTGMGSLSGAELSGERMSVAYNRRDQEDEHSCFSDNTHNDFRANIRGIQNVWLGRYPDLANGAGLDALVAAQDAALASQMTSQVVTSVSAVAAIPSPFDQAILGADTAPGRQAIAAAITALRTQTNTTVELASALCLSLNLEGETP